MNGVHTPETSGPNTFVVFGAAALDLYPAVGQIGADHVPGKKIGWTANEDAMLDAILDPSLPQYEAEPHIGGNALNVAAYLQRTETGNVVFSSVLGEDDIASEAIRNYIRCMGMVDATKTVPGYLPSISLIERAALGSDRMVRGRSRGLMQEYISDTDVQRQARGAGLVVAASLKDIYLATSVFEYTPEDTFLSFNPGSSEFRRYPQHLRSLMLHRQPDLLALNDEELQQLYGEDVRPETLAARATQPGTNKLANFVLCTLGKEGVLLAHNGDIIRQPAKLVSAENVVDTLGAGDRAHAVALQGLVRNRNPKAILADVVDSTAQLIQRVGAHGDIAARVHQLPTAA